jgi:hypothetical protein
MDDAIASPSLLIVGIAYTIAAFCVIVAVNLLFCKGLFVSILQTFIGGGFSFWHEFGSRVLLA